MPLAALAFVLAVLGDLSVIGSTTSPAQAAPTFPIGLKKASLKPTGKGLDLRLAVRGTTGRTIVSVAFRPAGAKGTRRQQHVLKKLHGRRFVTFHLHRLQQGARYTYSARAVSGERRSRTVAGRFTAATGTGAVTGSADVRDTSATLHGSLTPGKGGTKAWFAWNTTRALTTSRPRAGSPRRQRSPSGSRPRSPASRAARRTTTASSDGPGGTSQGAMRSFTTTGAATTTGPNGTNGTNGPAGPAGPAGPTATTCPTGPKYYVATNGSDSADGSAARPWRTLAKAAAATPPGAATMIAAGTYSGFTMTRSGRAGAAIAFCATTPGTVEVRPASGGSTIIISGQRDVDLTGLVVTGATGSQNAGIDVLDNWSGLTIANGRITGNTQLRDRCQRLDESRSAGNTITGNDTGIRINRSGAGVVIQGNHVNDNNAMVVNDTAHRQRQGASGFRFLTRSARCRPRATRSTATARRVVRLRLRRQRVRDLRRLRGHDVGQRDLGQPERARDGHDGQPCYGQRLHSQHRLGRQQQVRRSRRRAAGQRRHLRCATAC